MNVLLLSASLSRAFFARGRWFLPIVLITSIVLLLLLQTTPPEATFASQVADSFKDDGSEPLMPREVWMRLRYIPGHSRPHKELCPMNGEGIPLVMLLTSAPGHRENREAVRSTWGHAARHAGVTLAFMLGAPPSHLRQAVDEEDARYKDMIEANFIDSYSNLTLKAVSILEWFATYCHRASRLLKTDDDMFFNMDKLLNFVSEHNGTGTIWGEIISEIPPTRDGRFRYFTPEIEYPWPVYPAFPVGHAYLISADAVPALLGAAPDSRFVRLEDVFMGTLAARAGIRCVNSTELVMLPPSADHPCDIRQAIHKTVRYHEQFAHWAKLLDPDVACPLDMEAVD